MLGAAARGDGPNPIGAVKECRDGHGVEAWKSELSAERVHEVGDRNNGRLPSHGVTENGNRAAAGTEGLFEPSAVGNIVELSAS